MKPTQLIDHPEGGRYQEVFRSPTLVEAPARGGRSALTHIYFSLDAGESSLFHRVESDEVWNLYDGLGVRLYLWPDGSDSIEEVELTRSSSSFCHVVTAGTWQAAVPVGGRVLVGCSVAPGFEFCDFTIMQAASTAGRQLLRLRPDLAHLLSAPT